MKIVKPAKSRKKSAKIIVWDNPTRINLPPDRILSGATGKLENVALFGYDKDGDFYFASSFADGGDCLWLLEKMKKRLLDY